MRTLGFLFAGMALAAALSCSQRKTVYVSDAYVHGKVTCEGKGLEGVVVTDGVDFAETGRDGSYSIPLDRYSKFVWVTVPSGYMAPVSQGTIPQFYKAADPGKPCDFGLLKNPKDDSRHRFLVQADIQVTSMDDISAYKGFLKDMKAYKDTVSEDIMGFDVGDIVGDTPSLYPAYISAVSTLDMPIFRAIGNHDMTYGGRSFETSYSKFTSLFGPEYFSFNKGKAHYVVLDNCFYVDRDYQYIGYVSERQLEWLENDLSYVPEGSLVFVFMHIPLSSTEKIQWNKLLPDETSNAQALLDLLKGYKAHFITGHSHFNHNVVFGPDAMEHNTAAVCGIWWKADICMDGAPAGFGVYDVDGDDVRWTYKGFGKPEDYQMRVYPAGSVKGHPESFAANVWNWDEDWKVEWLEDGVVRGEMTKIEADDPEAEAICSDKERVVYDWISPYPTKHIFIAGPASPGADVSVRVTDRFGRVYEAPVPAAR